MNRLTILIIRGVTLGVTAIACISPAICQMKMPVLEWYADLQGANVTPKVATKAGGKAAFALDFDKSKVTVVIDTRNLKAVQKIELRLVNSPNDVNGPLVATLYDGSSDGPLLAHFQKVIGAPDFDKASAVISGGQGAVVIITKDHPEAEVAGIIKLHKSYR